MLTPRSTTIIEPGKRNNKEQAGPVQRDRRPGAQKAHTSTSDVSWRDSNDYRAQYFDKNHGIGGYGYICSQCWKPMFKKSQIQVDHIIPPSRVAMAKRKKGKWVKTSIMARFLNNSFNCAAICPTCNKKKSDKIDLRVVQGYMMKSLEVTYNIGQLVLSVPFMATAVVLWASRKVVVSAARHFRKDKRKRR